MKNTNFRAWCKETNQMYSVRTLPASYADVWTECTLWEEEEMDIIEYDSFGTERIVQNLEFMQSTWIEDKNWKEIYEGDILKIMKTSKGVVYFENWGFRTDCLFKSSLMYLVENKTTIEVIGNIYENSNLLTS